MKRPADSLPHQIFKMLESGIQKERDRGNFFQLNKIIIIFLGFFLLSPPGGALTRYTCTNGQDKVEIEVFDIDPYLSLYNKRFGSVLKIEKNQLIRIYTSQDQLKYFSKYRINKCDRIMVFLSTKDHENFRQYPGNFLELEDIPYTICELSDTARRKVKTYHISTKQDFVSVSNFC